MQQVTPMEKSIVLSDGTILDNSVCTPINNSLWCWISGKSIPDCTKLFSDILRTDTITAYYYTGGKIYHGYTKLLLVEQLKDVVDVRLTWPEGGAHSIEEIEESDEDGSSEET